MDLKLRGIAVQGDGIGAIGLQFDRIGTRGFGGINNLERGFKLAIVIGRQLGDEVGRVVRADGASGN